MAAIIEGRKFYELIRRDKSGDRSSNELRRVDGGGYGPRVANAAVSDIRFPSLVRPKPIGSPRREEQVTSTRVSSG